MTKVRYEIEIKGLGEGSNAIATKETQKQETELKSNVETSNPGISNLAKGTVGAIASVYAASQIVVNPIIREKINMASVTGDFVQAENIRRTQAKVNTFVNLGFEAASIATGFVVNPVIGGVMLLGSAVKHTQQAINREQNNRMIATQNTIDNFLNSYESARFVDVKKGR